MTFEISEGGLSAATANILKIGELVELNTALGAMLGFEFPASPTNSWVKPGQNAKHYRPSAA